jgi:hypothetical protein
MNRYEMKAWRLGTRAPDQVSGAPDKSRIMEALSPERAWELFQEQFPGVTRSTHKITCQFLGSISTPEDLVADIPSTGEGVDGELTATPRALDPSLGSLGVGKTTLRGLEDYATLNRGFKSLRLSPEQENDLTALIGGRADGN